MSGLPLARQTVSGWDQVIKIMKTDRAFISELLGGYRGGGGRAQNAATAEITRFSTAVHTRERSRRNRA